MNNNQSRLDFQLINAVLENNVENVTTLLKQGASPNAVGTDEHTFTFSQFIKFWHRS